MKETLESAIEKAGVATVVQPCATIAGIWPCRIDRLWV